MRAICCAILALVFFGMGAVAANTPKGFGLVSSIFILLSYVSIGFAIYLCILGL